LIKMGRSDIADIQEKVMSMYAKGLSDRDITTIIHDIYGFDISHGAVSRILARVQPRFIACQSRPLEKVYAFAYVDAMVVKVKNDGRARNKAVYSALGIDMEGQKDVLGLWINEHEGAHF
jgi:putative transposase